MKIGKDIKTMVDRNLCYLATASKEGKPNVAIIGTAKAISDHEVLMVDVLMRKTRNNLKENPEAAIAFMDYETLSAYQLKGRVKIISKGDLYEKTFQIMEEKNKGMEQFLEKIQQINSKLTSRAEKIRKMHHGLRPKAAVLITVEEIYSLIPE